jgi:phosphopantothenoylcysteine decarboxylase
MREPDVLPPADAIIVAPATVNTINKWAAGICDTVALGILVEAIGKKLPIVALPFTNRASYLTSRGQCAGRAPAAARVIL